MRPWVAKLVTRIYPRAWRERYGTEFEAFLEDGRHSLRALADVAGSALRERIFPSVGGSMDRKTNSFGDLVRRPSAFVPLAMSVTALAVVLGHIALFGVAREADEGAAAHIWQLLMAGQLPVLAFFAIKWLPRAPRQALFVLAAQAVAVLASVAPVYLLNL